MRAEFDLDPSLIYLNSANLSICPRIVLESLSAYQREFERNPTRGLAEAWGHLWDVQSGLAAFLSADPGDLFLRTNVTSVLNTFILGMPLPAGGEIVVGELEYGAIVNICRMRALRDGLRLRALKMPASVPALRRATPQSLVDLVISQISPQTRMILLSQVLGGIGLVLPIREIAEQTRARGIYLVVDGAYAPGALPVSFHDLANVDFYGCSLYKWMLGPKGTAFGWVAKIHQEHLQPLSAGWLTFGSFGPFSAFGEGNRFQERLLMAGCHDFSPFRAISQMLRFWREQGSEKIFARMKALQDHLANEITAGLGWLRLSSPSAALRGPLLAFRLPGRLQAQGADLSGRVYRELRIQANSVHLQGQWSLVFSPHVYNTEAEITEAVRRLEGL